MWSLASLPEQRPAQLSSCCLPPVPVDTDMHTQHNEGGHLVQGTVCVCVCVRARAAGCVCGACASLCVCSCCVCGKYCGAISLTCYMRHSIHVCLFCIQSE